jgi:oligoribonuclease (3'-5' exoribonuclease)
MDKWRFKCHLNTGLFEKMSQSAIQKIKSHENSSFAVILQVGAWYDLADSKNKI